MSIEAAEYSRTLENYPTLCHVSPRQIQALCAEGAFVRGQAGDVIFELGDFSTSFPFLLEGVARVLKVGSGSRDTLLYRLRSGEHCLLSSVGLLARWRFGARVVAETDATFHSPEPRSIVMTILEGEGKGSVVETHATPIEPGRTLEIEATLATSDRAGFRHAKKLQRFIRPFIERSARRLWVDDAAYAERLYELRYQSRE